MNGSRNPSTRFPVGPTVLKDTAVMNGQLKETRMMCLRTYNVRVTVELSRDRVVVAEEDLIDVVGLQRANSVDTSVESTEARCWEVTRT